MPTAPVGNAPSPLEIALDAGISDSGLEELLDVALLDARELDAAVEVPVPVMVVKLSDEACRIEVSEG